LLAVLISYKDTFFVMIASLVASAVGYVATYIGMNIFKLLPDKFWLFTFFTMIFSTSLYAWRISRKKWLQPELKPLPSEPIQDQFDALT